eukprot:TRINITY_DN76966_c0_g1_i1.p1 TRINITY_DN76966_c0_g1~~TRINITY_DN76966_c0_g1_i1.p1  ORF type:complete len:233 (-),score=39.91 TRINITY_DN76966_c0_g1_i1:16-714(-)
MEDGWVQKDTLVFKAIVSWQAPRSNFEERLKPEALAQYHLKSAFQTLFCAQWRSDYVLVAGEEEVPVHSIILGSRPSVFKAMFESSMVEGSSGQVHIPDVPPETLRSLCHLAYTGSLPENACQTDDDIHVLYMAAITYDIPSLAHVGSSYAKEHVTVENVVQWLSSASMVNVDALRSHCLNFAVEHLAEVQAIDGWNELVKNKQLFCELVLLLFQTIAPPAKQTRKVASERL